MHCPDCGVECNPTGTNQFGNVHCFDCRGCEDHWERYSDTVMYLFPWDSDDKCDICGSERKY